MIQHLSSLIILILSGEILSVHPFEMLFKVLQRSVDFNSTVVLEVRQSHILKDALREAPKLKFKK